MPAARALLLLAAVVGTSARWCQVENVKADANGDYTFAGPWRIDGCTTLSLDHGTCAESDCPYRNKFGDEEIIQLADALHGNGVLTALSLSSNELTDESVKALAEALRDNEVLNELNLQGNQIGDAGAIALAEVIGTNPAFTFLNIAHNQVTDVGGNALLTALKSQDSALETLHMDNNKMGKKLVAEADNYSKEALTPPADLDEKGEL